MSIFVYRAPYYLCFRLLFSVRTQCNEGPFRSSGFYFIALLGHEKRRVEERKAKINVC